MKHSLYSAVVVGSGIAGLFAAIKLLKEALLPHGLLIITKSRLTDSNSKYAQGGMVCVMRENIKDSCKLHIEDTIKAGAGLTDEKTAQFISEKSEPVVKELQNFGVNFDRDENNKLAFTKEAAHSVNRILHAGGDATGYHIENALAEYLLAQKGVNIYEQTQAVELLKDSFNTIRGLIAYNGEKDEYEEIESPAVILATGGAGQLYKYTTNPDITTGDGIALAYRAGAVMKDMEFVQFHPTAFALTDGGTMFLISEALRGEGAKLVHKDGSSFMEKYDKRLELAPRDIVTRAIFNEMNKYNLKNVYLNAAGIKDSKFKKRFPTIYENCQKYNINPSKQYIPVSPSAHYFMGGIKTNTDGTTSLKGLYAIGETACTGLHGANRLASNSILECAVTAYELAGRLKNTDLNCNCIQDENMSKTVSFYENEVSFRKTEDTDRMLKRIKELMWNNAGIIRNGKKLLAAKEELAYMSKQFGSTYKCKDKKQYELRNMLITAALITEFALNRKESRGAHYRDDYPQKDLTAKSQSLSKDIIMKG